MTETMMRDIAAYLSQNGYCYQTDYPLSVCSSFKIGGNADFAVWCENADQLIGLISVLRSRGVRYDVFGNCSNVLFSDNGYRGVVIFTTHMREVEVRGCVIKAGCGASVTPLAQTACKHGLSGMEFAYGIPGSTGGAVYMNAGAFERQIDDVLIYSTCYDVKSDSIRVLNRAEHNFDYRRSIYTDNSDFIVLSAEFELTEGEQGDINERMNGFLQRRRDRQPLEYPSAGSVFKRYPGYFTAKLIEEAGLKGRRVGGAEVSVKHAGFIVNIGGATSDDVKRLIDIIKETIYRINNIEIECEIRFIDSEL